MPYLCRLLWKRCLIIVDEFVKRDLKDKPPYSLWVTRTWYFFLSRSSCDCAERGPSLWEKCGACSVVNTQLKLVPFVSSSTIQKTSSVKQTVGWHAILSKPSRCASTACLASFFRPLFFSSFLFFPLLSFFPDPPFFFGGFPTFFGKACRKASLPVVTHMLWLGGSSSVAD